MVTLCCGESSSAAPAAPAAGPLEVLIVDGQNNHGNWPQTTKMMKRFLEDTGRFTVDVVTHAPKGADPSFKPAFHDYAVVVSNFGHGATAWPEETKAAFEQYVQGGGGLVVVHAADNSFPEWPAYNRMIGLGGWGGRNEKSGPFVYYTDDGRLVRDEAPGPGGSHGPQAPFAVVVRDDTHPVTKGMPATWMHATDELYNSLRGPAENMKAPAEMMLSTAACSERSRWGSAACTRNTGPRRLTSNDLAHASGVNEPADWASALAALLTTTSIPPKCAAARSASSGCSGSPRCWAA